MSESGQVKTTRRFKTAGKVEALLYEGSFPLDFLQYGEKVGTVPGRGLDDSCQIEAADYCIKVEKGELLIRDLDGSLFVLSEAADV